jgi:hypothetical protein
MIFQSIVFPKVSRVLGILRSTKLALTLMVLVYAVLPFTTLIEPAWLRQSALFVAWMCKTLSTTFAFPGCTILLTNTASSIRVLGTVNGITTSVGAIGRAIGPSLVGAAFTWGVHHGMLIVPFGVLTFLGMLALPPLIWAVEGDGFGNDDDEDDFDDDEVDCAEVDWQPNIDGADAKANGNDVETILSPTGAMRLRRTSLSGGHNRNVSLEEAKDQVAPLGITSTLAPPEKFASAIVSDNEDDDDADTERAASPFLQPPPHFVGTRLGRTKGDSRPKVRRRSTTPIGDTVGFRKLSSNLGVSRSGYGSGSELG